MSRKIRLNIIKFSSLIPLFLLDIVFFKQIVKMCLLFIHWSDYSNYIEIA